MSGSPSQRNSRISIEIERDLPAAKVELGAAERMFARMLAATIGLAREGETIAATMAMGQIGGQQMLCLSIDRPRAIDGLDEARLARSRLQPRRRLAGRTRARPRLRAAAGPQPRRGGRRRAS